MAKDAQNRCIVVFGTKGGVGKTIVATNLAVSLAQRTKKPVCLVDIDTMAVGDIAKSLNLTTNRSMLDLAPALRKQLSAQDFPLSAAIVQHASGVHLLPMMSSHRQFGQLEASTLGQILAILKQRYEYVIIDGGKGFSEPLITAFEAAHMILLVMSPDVITLYQTKWALGMMESLLFPSAMVKAVLNRAESRGGVGSNDVRMAIPCEIIGEIPSDGSVVGNAVNQGLPIATAAPQSRVAAAFNRLAEVLETRPELYIAHQDVPRHNRPPGGTAVLPVNGARMPSYMYDADGGEGLEPVDEIVLMKRRIHDKLVEELDLKRLDLASMAHNAQLQELRVRTERVITNLLAKEMGGLIASQEVRARLVREISDEALGYGPLEELLADPSVTDILVNNKDQIYVERKGRLELTTKKFISNDQVRAVIERIIAPLGRRIDESTPMVDARLPDGSRVNAVIPPLAIKGPALSIRKFARVRYSGEDLIRMGSVSPEMVKFMSACVHVRKNMIISGGTGSGKTTFLNVVSTFIPEGERIVTIEDAAELKLSQTHWVSMESRPPSVEGKGAIGIRDLFRNSLRMRPDRIIIGECRGGESLDMLQAMNTGHDGSITTVHANSPRDVVSRLDSMVLMSSIELPIRAIHEMIASAIHIILHTARLADGSRKITAITELTGINSNGELQMQDIFIYRQSGMSPQGEVMGRFEATGTLPTFLHELIVKGLGVDPEIFRAPAAA
jgi:septum site-determining protein MinD